MLTIKLNNNKKIWVTIFLIIFIILKFISIVDYSKAQNASIKNKNIDLIYNIPIKNDFNPALSNFIQSNIKEAEKNNVDLIILEISSFGGIVDSAIVIKDTIINTQIPVISYVSERAWSAAALVALAGDELVMKNGSSIGAAETRPNEEKYISALRKEFASTAELRGRKGKIAEAMVDSDIRIEGLVESGKLLTLTANEAYNNKIADLTVNNYEELLTNYNLNNSNIENVSFPLKMKFANLVTTPIFSILLLTIAFIALISEALIPGWGVGGTIGLISLGTFFSAFIMTGYAHWGLIVLFLVGLLLLFLEAFIVPGFGVTGIGGLIAIFSSLFFFFPTPNIALIVIASVLVLSIIALVFIVKIFGVSKLWRNISLGESLSNDRGYTSHSDKKELLNKRGITLTHLRPAGTAEINEKRIDVVSEGDYIDKGKKIKVIKVEGSRVVVKKIKEES